MDKPFTKTQQDFIAQYARKLLVEWCLYQLRFGNMPTVPSNSGRRDVYLDHAESKGWVNKAGSKVLSKGFSTAAAFLRR